MEVLKKSKERTEADRSILREKVSEIIDNVVKNGDKALKEYNSIFDKCEREIMQISQAEIENAYAKVSQQDIEDIKKAAANIKAFAEAQKKTIGVVKDFSLKRGDYAGAQSNTRRIVLLLCTGRRIPPLFNSTYAGHTCQNCGCEESNCVLPCY